MEITFGDDVLVSWGCHFVDHNAHSIDVGERSNDVADWAIGKKDWSNVVCKPIEIKNRLGLDVDDINRLFLQFADNFFHCNCVDMTRKNL